MIITTNLLTVEIISAGSEYRVESYNEYDLVRFLANSPLMLVTYDEKRAIWYGIAQRETILEAISLLLSRSASSIETAFFANEARETFARAVLDLHRSILGPDSPLDNLEPSDV